MSLLFFTHAFWNVFNPSILISREKNLKIEKNEKKKKKGKKKRFGSAGNCGWAGEGKQTDFEGPKK